MNSSSATPLVPALVSGIKVLEAIARDPDASRSISALAAQLGIPQASCYRIVRTLEQTGWLKPGADGAGHELGAALRSLLGDVNHEQRLAEAVQPLLESLAAEHELTFKLSVRHGDQATTLARAQPDSPFVITGQIGARFHLCFGSVGPVLLRDASSDEIARLCRTAPAAVWRHQTPQQFRRRLAALRREGHCLDRGSYHPDIHGLSVPVELHAGSQAAGPATLTAIATASTLTPQRVRKLLAAMQRAAERCHTLTRDSLP